MLGNPTQSRFRPDIEGLRAIAVLLVLFFHAGLPPRGGYIGVDIFFVISGFLITSLLIREAERTGTISLSQFYARRVRRLLPAASLVLLTTLPLIHFLAPETQRTIFGIDIVAAAAYFANWRFADRSVDYLAEDIERSPVLHFWSLSVEEQFYFIWPLVLVFALFLAKRYRLSLRRTMTTALLLVVLPSFYWSLSLTTVSPSEAFFVTSTRLWELGIGAILALNVERLTGRSLLLSRGLGVIGLLMLFASAFLLGAQAPWPGYLALIPTLGATFVIASGAISQVGFVQSLLGARSMVWIGGLSYSLYLWHWPVLVVGQDWLKFNGTGSGAVLVLLSVVPAWLSYRFIETPFRTFQRLQSAPWPTLSQGLNFTLLAITASLLLSFAHTSDSAEDEEVVDLDAFRGRVIAEPANLGAGSLGRNPKKSKEGHPQTNYDEMIPDPATARNDVPRAYLEGCQDQRGGTNTPKWCTIGQLQGKTTAVVVGDSKILQYYEALDAAGKALGWRITTATKSSCPFVNASTSTECEAFQDAVLIEVKKKRPDYLITSQRASEARYPSNAEKKGQKPMIDGLRSMWSEVTELGTEVIVVLDNPHPTREVRPVYECLVKHPQQAHLCAFARSDGIERSSAPVMKKAAKGLPDVHLVDLTDYICPQKLCPPVIGDVVVYRQGSHLTNTYARSLAPVLTDQLREIATETQHL